MKQLTVPAPCEHASAASPCPEQCSHILFCLQIWRIRVRLSTKPHIEEPISATTSRGVRFAAASACTWRSNMDKSMVPKVLLTGISLIQPKGMPSCRQAYCKRKGAAFSEIYMQGCDSAAAPPSRKSGHFATVAKRSVRKVASALSEWKLLAGLMKRNKVPSQLVTSPEMLLLTRSSWCLQIENRKLINWCSITVCHGA